MFIRLCLSCVLSLIIICHGSAAKLNMIGAQLYANIAADPSTGFDERIQAVRQLASLGENKVLLDLLDRKPENLRVFDNYDEFAIERMLSVSIIEILVKMGDLSQIGRVQDLIQQSNGNMSGKLSEPGHLAQAINNIGSMEILNGIFINLKNGVSVANYVRILNNLHLPQAPIRSNTKIVLGDIKVSYKVQMIKDELLTLQALSQGKLQLSPALLKWANENDYDRGDFEVKEESLSQIVEHDLNFEYFVTKDVVVLGTPEDSALHWLDWWGKYKNSLLYDHNMKRFQIYK